MTKLGVHFPVINHNTDFCEKVSNIEYAWNEWPKKDVTRKDQTMSWRPLKDTQVVPIRK